MELVEIGHNTYKIEAPVRLGLVVNEDHGAVLIDAGIDESAARRVRRLLSESGLTLKGIIITHAHADHCGAVPFLVKATQAKVYATPFEKTAIEHPVWEPLYLFGGANPPADLRTKFFMAPGAAVDGVLSPGPATVEGCPVEIVDLAGHSPAQIGVAVQGVLFCADSVLGEDALEKHRLPLNVDIESTLRTFAALERRHEKAFVQCHGTVIEAIGETVASNRNRVLQIADAVLSVLQTPKTREDLVAEVCQRFDALVDNLGQHCLANLTVMAHVAYLMDARRVVSTYTGNRQYFEAT